MQDYFRFTRSPWYSFLFVLPLLGLYQVVTVVANAGSPRPVVNGADALLQRLLGAAGLHGWLGSWLVIAALAGAAIYRLDPAHRSGPLRRGYFGLLLVESSFYALLFGGLVSVLVTLIFPGAGFLRMGDGAMSFGQVLSASLGAGLFEELLFRLLLMGGAILVLRRLRWKPAGAVGLAVLASSLLFSAFHYVGALAEPFQLGSFLFRFVAGVVLALLFFGRGFAVTAWTHSLYDVFLLLRGA